MIDVLRYTEMVQEIRGKVNADLLPEEQITGVIVSPKEEHLVKKLGDREGVQLCSNYPSCDTTVENSDRWGSDNQCLFFVLEKVSPGSQTDGDELEHYAKLQKIMELVKKVLMGDNFSCDYSFDIPHQIRTEWEYNTYGGFNGLSIGFNLKDND